jgi:hypothetical protein
VVSDRKDQPEWRLSHYVDVLLDRILDQSAPTWYTAVETGSIAFKATVEARMRIEQRRRARGIKPAHLDWYVYQQPLFTQIELKYGHSDETDGETRTISQLQSRKIPAACCYTIGQVYEHLKNNGFRLHGNAENITREVEKRWQATDESKRGAKSLATKLVKRRAPKPSMPADQVPF